MPLYMTKQTLCQQRETEQTRSHNETAADTQTRFFFFFTTGLSVYLFVLVARLTE